MDELKINSLIKKGIDDYMNQKQYNLSKIQNHEHNGIDSLRVNESNLINSNMYQLGIAMNANETFYIRGVSSFKSMTFYGIAANGGYGVGPHTKKATITGEVQIGATYGMSINSTGTTFQPAGYASNFSQSSTSIYVDTTDSSKMFVSASGAHFARVINDSTGTEVASAKIDSITNNIIAITSTVNLADGWYIQGYMLFS